ncbi:RNA polymerase II largest subunit [Carex littledalei]|uniref:RNA polymerase II largest subunit n=1 Tax=Carex littledalei TaxID=544730 RepID=A0A833QM25_9POAL|nr:RNA polymerase II largest subunit [Carex littledalei]
MTPRSAYRSAPLAQPRSAYPQPRSLSPAQSPSAPLDPAQSPVSPLSPPQPRSAYPRPRSLSPAQSPSAPLDPAQSPVSPAQSPSAPLKRGSISKGKAEHALKKMLKEGAYWGN